jgi:hypothetical protein
MRRALAALVLGAAVLAAAHSRTGPAPGRAAQPAGPKKAEAGLRARVARLEAELKRLDGLVPDQAAVMRLVSYHWGNLWFAIREKNWALAEFYLGETRNNLHWAVRARRYRDTKAGKIDLKAIAEALENAQLKDMQKAIAARDRDRCVKLYDDALTGCYACHTASEKPYLRPQRPTAPETHVINFDPRAREPR